MFMAGIITASPWAISSGGMLARIAWWIADDLLDADGGFEGRHDHPLLDVLVLEVVARERRQREVEAVHLRAGVGDGEGGGLGGHLVEVVHAGLEGEVVDLDALGEVGQPGLEHRLDGGVLVLGVAGEEVHDVGRRGRPGRRGRRPRDGSMRPASAVTENSSTRMPLWMSL